MKKRRIISSTALVFILTFALTAVMTACGSSGDVDSEALKAISGEYQAKGIYNKEFNEYDGSYWHLSIIPSGTYDHENDYLSIYDNSAGNPGVEGDISYLDSEKLKVRIDTDYYEELPDGDWECDGETLELSYQKTDEGIVLTNNGKDVLFLTEE